MDYRLTTAYGSSTVLDPTLLTSHSQPVSGLSASTLYHYRVTSRDAAGNLATSSDFTFTTSAPPPAGPIAYWPLATPARWSMGRRGPAARLAGR